MKILVTGATGYLGSHLVRHLMYAGFQPILLKRSTSDVARIRDLLPELPSYDIDRCSLEQPFREQGPVSTVLHTATLYGRGRETISDLWRANVVFPVQLLETAARHGTDIFINTDTTLPKDVNGYALTKHQFAEWGKYYASQQQTLGWLNVRLEYMYGPGMPAHNLITGLVRKCLAGRDAIPMTTGEQRRDFIYIEDVVTAYEAILRSLAKTKDRQLDYDLGSGEAIAIRELACLVRDLTGSSVPLQFGALPSRPYEPLETKADLTSMGKLRWRPRKGLRDGILEVIAYDGGQKDNAIL